MSYEDRDGYGVTRPRTIKTPEGTWNFYPKKSAIERRQMEEGPPEEAGYDNGYGGGGEASVYDIYDPFGQSSGSNGGGYQGDTGGIMGDVDIGGFADAFDIFGSSGRRRRR